MPINLSALRASGALVCQCPPASRPGLYSYGPPGLFFIARAFYQPNFNTHRAQFLASAEIRVLALSLGTSGAAKHHLSFQ